MSTIAGRTYCPSPSAATLSPPVTSLPPSDSAVERALTNPSYAPSSINGPTSVAGSSGEPIGSVSYAARNRPMRSSLIELWTSTRRNEVQRCPAVPTAEKTMPRTARSRSALGATIAALLPPSSSRLRPSRAATRGATSLPMRVDPVAETSAIRGSSTNTWPVSRSPRMSCAMSSGAPARRAASRASALHAIPVSSVFSEGFHTTASPQTKASAVFQDHTATGKLNAEMTPTTPSGCHSHPLGVVGVISAFNFPVAVWSWNTALAFVCGDAVVWKPSEKTLLTGIACNALAREAARRAGAPEDIAQLILGDRETGQVLVEDPRIALVSATGSTRMGKDVAPRVAARLGRSLLELGGNNAAIVAPSADLDLAVRGIVFSAVGTAGQRCTSLRRVLVHNSIKDDLIGRLRAAYETLPIGSPLDPATLVGPLIDEGAYEGFVSALSTAESDGGKLVTGGDKVAAEGDGQYVRPAIVDMPAQTQIMKSETFAPILYVLGYDDFDKAIALHNAVTQGLSSSIFTLNVREAEQFMSATGSDCGIANVNIGPSGAEIGGAFGGEKETGGGRESGSDAWKSYMRRTTNTVNYSTELPLAQGVEFV